MSNSETTPQQKQLNEELGDEGIEIRGPVTEDYMQVLTEDALRFLAGLHREFDGTRQQLLEDRQTREQELQAGKLPHFLDETESVREGDWSVAPIPDDLQKRFVEITGPVDRKMIINALNSGADVYMADFEDAHAPGWHNNVQGQLNLMDAVRRQIELTTEEGKEYQLDEEIATLMVRPRGWHLPEKHLLVDGDPISGSLFDFGLYFFHNARELLDRGSGPYFYLPKLENHREARLWNDVFEHAQEEVGVPHGSVRVTVLIENILAAFEMEEILYELRDHICGLNGGRWDYIFSFIKKFRHDPDYVLPDRDQVTMDRHFLSSYIDELIRASHKRGAHAMGGMAAQIPIKDDPEANERALEAVRQDKVREVNAGHDGTWVAHPGLVEVARKPFEDNVEGANQIERKLDVEISQEDLLKVPDGTVTEEGLRHNVDVAIQYLESWIGGMGCVPIYNLMEDAATSEISRAQVWQWLHHGVTMENGETVDEDLVKETIQEELENLRNIVGEEYFESGNYDRAAELFENMTTSDDFLEFMPLVAYDYLE